MATPEDKALEKIDHALEAKKESITLTYVVAQAAIRKNAKSSPK
ncbi:MAG: hypothetical protein OJF51_004242 [Nitrospira sp.]|nr:MAG: hypothetical protein OJF51_004242 [Nitrospira sp.]